MHHTKLITALPQKLTLCLSRASIAKVPKLMEKEKMGDRVQGEPDLSGKIVQGNLKPHSTYL